MDYKEEQNGEIEALLSIYEGEIEGKLREIFSLIIFPSIFHIMFIELS